MKLHANAALSLNKRRLLVARVIEEEWSLTKAAEAAEVSEPTARTMLGGWAYGAIYRSSAERTAALEGWLWRYNFRRPHGSLGRRPPAARLRELNNALGSYRLQACSGRVPHRAAALEAAGLWA